MRAHQLRALHERTSDAFALAVGFGPVRMTRLRPGVIRVPDVKPVPLPRAGDEYSPDAPPAEVPDALAAIELPEPPAIDHLQEMHDGGLNDLFASERMGYVRDREHVAGFQSHAFSQVPRLPFSEWHVVRLDLIGVLSHDQPVAYVTEELPRMEELKRIPMRELDAFEQAALARLRTDEDVVTDEGRPGVMRMVGSLRAASDCLECHAVRRGQLLGALSYELRPASTPPVRIEPPQEPQAVLIRTRTVAKRDNARCATWRQTFIKGRKTPLAGALLGCGGRLSY